MSLPQQKFREIVLQLLYSEDLAKPDEKDMIDLIMHELSVTKRSVIMAQEKVKLIQSHLKEIDQMISKTSVSYDLDRIHAVIKNVLRIGIYELFYDESIPPRVAIAEAMRLARKFGTPEASAFVNALLDHLYQASQGHQVSKTDLEKKAIDLVHSEEEANKAAEEARLQHQAESEDEEE